jgi:simple sugar transport system ATP-binding protein
MPRGGAHAGLRLFLRGRWSQGGRVETPHEYVLRMKGIEKEYYGTRVLKGIDLDIRPGEVLGIVGENGAGKSTLMNILFGMSVIHSTGGYGGTIEIAGDEVRIESPFDAMKLGIGMVHQEFMLIPGYSITENIKLNREITKENLLSRVLGPVSRRSTWLPWAAMPGKP